MDLQEVGCRGMDWIELAQDTENNFMTKSARRKSTQYEKPLQTQTSSSAD